MDPRSAIKRQLAGATVLVETIAVPHHHKPLRLPTFPNLERTAVFSAISTMTLGVSSNASCAAVVLRSPVYPLWSFGYPTQDGLNGTLSAFATVDFATNSGTNISIDFDERLWIEGLESRVNGYAPLVGVYDDDTYIYVPQNTIVVLEVDMSASVCNEYSFIYEVRGTKKSTVLTKAATPAASSFTVVLTNTSGVNSGGYWYRPVSLVMENGTTAAAIGSIRLGYCTAGTLNTPTGTMSGPAMVPIGGPVPPEYSNFRQVYDSLRSNANAVLFQNVTSVLNKEGTVRCTRLPTSALASPWDTAWANTTLFLAANPVETYYGPLEKGLYTYTLADSSSSTLRVCSFLTKDNSDAPLFAIDGFDYVNCILFTDLDTTSATNLAVEIDYHNEFRTSSALFTLGFSAVTLEDYHHAQMALAKMGVFFENPLHLRDIAALAKRGLVSLAPYARTAGMLGLRTMATAGGPVASRVADLALTAIKMAGNMKQSNPGNPTPGRPPKKVVVKKKAKVKSRKR